MNRSGDAARVAHKTLIAAEPTRGRTRSQRPTAIAGQSHRSEQHTQSKKLRAHMPARGVDKLGEDSEEKIGVLRFRVFTTTPGAYTSAQRQ